MSTSPAAAESHWRRSPRGHTPGNVHSVSLAVVLGAGFSKAVDTAFPTADQLGELVRRDAPGAFSSAPSDFSGGLFERWLSRIAEPQPDLTEEANLANARDFQIVTQALHRVMVGIEGEVIRKRTPWWLLRFVGILHLWRATVVTFNYDTLIEGAASRTWDHRISQMLNSYSITDGVPPTPPAPGAYGPIVTPTFRLLKLHGSLDTYWVPNDFTGATVTRIADALWLPKRGMNDPDLNVGRQAPGRVPFVVPPASAKSALFSNPITRQLWRTAAEGLAAAKRIAVLGYSAPLTDLVATAMLADAQRSGGGTVEVVNPQAQEVVDHLLAAGMPEIAVRQASPSCEAYVDQLEIEAALGVNEMLLRQDPTLPVCVGGGMGQLMPVVGVRQEPDTLVVEVGPPVGRQAGIDTRGWLTLGALVGLLETGQRRPTSIVTRGETARLIDAYVWPSSTASDALLVLIPSAARVWSD